MSMPGSYDLDVVAGDTSRRKYKIQTDGVNVDMTGWVWNAQVRTDYLPGGKLVGTATVTVDLAESKVEVVFVPAQTAEFPRRGRLVWDLEADVGGEIRTWLAGRVTVHPEVTRV